jgi:hypothetical protein
MILEFTNKAEYLQARSNWKEQKVNLEALQRQYKIMRNPANQPDRPDDAKWRSPKTMHASRAQYDLYVGKQKINNLQHEIAEAKKKASAQYIAQRDSLTVA